MPSPFSVPKRKMSCSQPEAFIDGKFLGQVAQIGCLLFSFWCLKWGVQRPFICRYKMKDRYCGEPLDHQQGWLFRSCISKLQLHSLRQRSPQHPMPLPPKSNLFKSDHLIFFLLKSYCKHSHQDKELHPERTLRTLPILRQSVVEKEVKPCLSQVGS